MTLEQLWYTDHWLSRVLLPLAGLFCAVVQGRRYAYHHGLARYQPPVPVIIVGNLTVGGTGKTPLVIWLGRFLKQQGFSPGIVSRGYGGHAKTWPQAVVEHSDPDKVGDESLLLARHSGCPVVVAPQRAQAVQWLLTHHPCDLIISDDGLQHYALQRDIEIIVVDGQRRYGNCRCLPAGPLREPLQRAQHADFLVVKEKTSTNPLAAHMTFSMQYQGDRVRQVVNEQKEQPLNAFYAQSVHAVAGIGHPALFFDYLRSQGLNVQPHAFSDHHVFRRTDIDFQEDWPIIMTEKDAVKCRLIANEKQWYLPVTADLPDVFGQQILNKLKEIRHG